MSPCASASAPSSRRALLAAATYGGLFTLLAASSFVFIRLMELSRIEYAALMFVIVLAYVGGTLLCRRLLVRFGVQRTVARAAG